MAPLAIVQRAAMGILTTKQTWRREVIASGEQSKQLGNRLSLAERDNVRQAIIYLCGRYESMAARCEALGLTRDALLKARSSRRAQTYRLACLAARAADVPVEKILSGLWPGDRCPHCGGTGKASQVVERVGRPRR